MRKKGYKGRCEKRTLSKCPGVCRIYDPIQSAYADLLQADEDIKEFRCNVILENLPIGDYMTDFVCVKTDDSVVVRECVQRNHLMKPMTVKLLDASLEYWRQQGITDWRIITNEE